MMDEWERFRKAYQERTKDHGSPPILTESQRLTESLGTQDTRKENVGKAVPDLEGKESSMNITITSNHQIPLRIPFSQLAKGRTSTHTSRIRQTYTERTWYCVVCGAENASKDRDGGITYSCRSCGHDVRTALSENAERIFGGKA